MRQAYDYWQDQPGFLSSRRAGAEAPASELHTQTSCVQRADCTLSHLNWERGSRSTSISPTSASCDATYLASIANSSLNSAMKLHLTRNMRAHPVVLLSTLTRRMLTDAALKPNRGINRAWWHAGVIRRELLTRTTCAGSVSADGEVAYRYPSGMNALSLIS